MNENNEHFTGIQTGKKVERDWSALRGELSIYLLTIVTGISGFAAWEDTKLRREEIAVSHRLIQRLDTDTLVTERALAHLEDRLPSTKARQYHVAPE